MRDVSVVATAVEGCANAIVTVSRSGCFVQRVNVRRHVMLDWSVSVLSSGMLGVGAIFCAFTTQDGEEELG